MGSPITFSGFNNIDFGAVLSLVMQQERAPITRLETEKTDLKTQNTALATFATKLGTLETAIADLAKADSLASLTATSSDSAAVGISTATGTLEGTYAVVVSELARPQALTSSTYSSLDDVVATSGTIRFTKAGGSSVDLEVSGSLTLKDLAAQINQLTDSPAKASVVQVSPGSYRLVLTSAQTGTANAFTVSMPQALDGGAGLTFTDTNGNGIYGDSADDNAQSASDASLTINGVPITSSSNVVNGAIPGVTLTLASKDPSKTVTVNTTRNDDNAKKLINKFISAYNDVLTFIKDQTTAAAAGKANIARDPLVRSLRDALSAAMRTSYGSGSLRQLAAVGIGFDVTGKATLKEDLFKASLESSQSDVQTLFAGAGSAGAFGALKSIVNNYTKAGGLISGARQRLDAQVVRLDDRLATLEDQLALRRASLQQEFIAADRAMSQLNSQGGSLAQLANQYRLF